jgi:hypothetical protein
LAFLHRFDAFVARALVIRLRCEVKEVHELCRGTVSRSRLCSVCRGRECSVVRELVLVMTIDDGSG